MSSHHQIKKQIHSKNYEPYLTNEILSFIPKPNTIQRDISTLYFNIFLKLSTNLNNVLQNVETESRSMISNLLNETNDYFEKLMEREQDQEQNNELTLQEQKWFDQYEFATVTYLEYEYALEAVKLLNKYFQQITMDRFRQTRTRNPLIRRIRESRLRRIYK